MRDTDFLGLFDRFYPDFAHGQPGVCHTRLDCQNSCNR
jgi:hypothetical protein